MITAKLVFVDDDPDDRALVGESLAKLEANRFVLFDSSNALFNYLGSLQEKDLPDAIWLDVHMTREGGLQILQHLKSVEDYQRIPVFILTATFQADIKQQCITEGAAGFYTKPNSAAELDALLEEVYHSL